MTVELVHFDKAKTEIALAASVDEVKNIRDKAEALRQYVRQQGETLEMQNRCAEIKIRAERRAGEMLREQIPHEGGRPKQLHDETVKLSDLGISKIQSYRWQQEANVPEERFEEHIAEITSHGGELTSAGVLRLANVHVANNSGENEWYTPPEYITAARLVMGSIDIDPASSDIANETIQATTYYTTEANGLQKEWHGNVWLNPPYAQPLVAEFTRLLAEKYDAGEVLQACALVNNATETTWFQRMLDSCSAICFPRGRVRFIDAQGNPSGAPLQGQAVVYFGSNVVTFNEVFNAIGTVLYKG